MGVILAKFRREKSTEAVLEALQEKITALEAFTINTQEQKKRIVGNFLAISIAVYVIAFVVFYFIYFPQTWKDRLFYCIPLLLFPIIIILLRYLFTWYFQRKLNKTSKKLTALRAEKKKILEQVMDNETYKVAVNLLARYGEKSSKTTSALSPTTPNKPLFNRSLQAGNLTQRSQQLALSSTPHNRTIASNIASPRPKLFSQNSDFKEALMRRTPFPIVNQQEKGIFERIVDKLIGDGPEDRYGMICRECYSNNGMVSKDDFEYTTFRCVFCNALNPAPKTRPVAPRLSIMPPTKTTADSDTSDSKNDDDDSDDEQSMNLKANTSEQLSIKTKTSSFAVNDEDEEIPTASFSDSSSDTDKEKSKSTSELRSDPDKTENKAAVQVKPKYSLDELLKKLEKSDSAIEDTTKSPE